MNLRIALVLFSIVGILSLPFSPITIPINTIEDVNSPEFRFLQRKRADPCARFTTPATPDCAQLPDSSVTILIPSETSSNEVGPNRNVPNMVAAVVGGTQQLTIQGLRFLVPGNGKAIGASYPNTLVNSVIGVGDIELGCSAGVALGDQTPVTVTDTTLVFTIPVSWSRVVRELEDRPRPLCIARGTIIGGIVGVPLQWFYTGFKIGVVWNCEILSGVATCPPPPSTIANMGWGMQSISFEKAQERMARKTCCKGTTPVTTEAGILNVGQCIFGPAQNTLAPQTCCGDAAIELATEQCCNTARSMTQYKPAVCVCTADELTCPTNQQCCLKTKYPELVARTNPNLATETALAIPTTAYGECFNPATHLCCDSGMRFDPGAQQCCPINGVQSANVPCPCAVDAHCLIQGAQLRCCAQVNSTTMEFQQCNAYNNYPSGTGFYRAQRCPGNCFDPTYQICCNGVQCIMAYEKCCNSTCCNRFTQTCSIARHSGTPGNRYNFNEFNVKYESCSTIENLTPLKIYYPIVLPTFNLVMSLICTGLCLVFANKASSRSYAAIEKSMIYIAIACIIFDIILYFSPAWKYGLFILFVQCFTILAAAARVRWLNIWSLVLTVALAIYLVDPFHGNTYLTLASSRTPNYYPDRDSAGLIHVIGKMYKNALAGPSFCTTYYLSYFQRDPQLRDLDRYDNPANTTFGYCDRAYVLVLLVFCALIYVCVLLQLILNLLALLLRFNKSQVGLVIEEDE